MKKVLLWFCILCVCFAWIVVKRVDRHIRKSAQYPLSRQAQYRFALKNHSNHPIKDAIFWTYAPVEQTQAQFCVCLNASYPYQEVSDDFGNRMLRFSFRDFPPYATKIVTITAQLHLAREPNQTFLNDSRAFLGPEPYLDLGNEEILQLAQMLKGESAFRTTGNIFRWVAKNVRYAGYSDKIQGALYALKHRKGDCTEFMYLFVSLCRACGIPARGMAGYVCKEDRVLKAGDYHNWAEFYENGTWKMADPQKGVFMGNRADYIAMKIIRKAQDDIVEQFDRFRCEGEGLKVKME